MSVELTVLGSGSGGNATLLAHAGRYVLIDVGLSYRDVTGRLEQLGVAPASVEAIVITHAHGDHTRGVAVLSRRHEVPVYATEEIRSEWSAPDVVTWGALTPGRAADVCGMGFEPFAVPHDAAAVGFRIDTPAGAIGYATDFGVLTRTMVDRFRNCRAGRRVESRNGAVAGEPVRPVDTDAHRKRGRTSVE